MSERRSIIKRFLVLAALMGGVRAQAQAPLGESQVKAMFVYNFLKFVEWPAQTAVDATQPFVVFIIGEGATADATERYLETRTIGDRPLSVRRARWDQSLAGAHAAFVVEHDKKKLRHLLVAAMAGGVLTIGEGDDFTTRGGMIALLVLDRKVRFDVDTSAAQSAGLRVSSKLLALTRTVRSATDRSGSRQ